MCRVVDQYQVRQPVGLAHGGAGDDLGGQGQVQGHAADDHDLLSVLLAEVGMLGTHGREEDGHHRGHAVEVARPSRALQRPGDGADADPSPHLQPRRGPRRSATEIGGVEAVVCL